MKFGVSNLQIPCNAKILNKNNLNTYEKEGKVTFVSDEEIKKEKRAEEKKKVISSSNSSGELSFKEEKNIRKEVRKREEKLEKLYDNPINSMLDEYTTRDLSTLDFNKRVLERASDQSNPLFERAKYLSIYSSNTDEFLSVRYGSAINAAKEEEGDSYCEFDVVPPGMEEKMLKHKIELNYQKSVIPIYEQLMNELKGKRVLFVSNKDELTSSEYEYIEKYFYNFIKAALTPLIFDNNRMIPKIKSEDINIAYIVSDDEYKKFGFMNIPDFFDRMIEIPSTEYGGSLKVMLIEDVVAMFIGSFFRNKTVEKVTPFRMLKSSDVSYKDETMPTTEVIKNLLKKREDTSALRLEYYGEENELVKKLKGMYCLNSRDVVQMQTPFELSFLLKLKDLNIPEEVREEMVEEKYEPIVVKELDNDESIIKTVKKKDILIHHPYESYESVLDYIDELADDPKTMSIKMTLYRTAKKSRIVKALARAALAGKNVTVITELKARFDEENNLKTAHYLENCGATVIYGFENKKVHAKLFLATRRSKNGIRKYAHIGTGNYNEKNAKMYTDFSLLTANPDITNDVEEMFNMLSGFGKPELKNLISYPKSFRQELKRMIDNEIRFGREGYICIKVNHIADKELVDKIYEAASKGVKIDIVVRTSCSLLTNREKYPNLRVKSNVGKFLEHHRVYYFKHLDVDNKEAKEIDGLFISSSDLMRRNLDHRIECTTKILSKKAKEKILKILAIYILDDTCYRLYEKEFVQQRGRTIDVQTALIRQAKGIELEILRDVNLCRL